MTEERLHQTLIQLLWILLITTVSIYFLLLLPGQGLLANGEESYLYGAVGSFLKEAPPSFLEVSRLGAALNSAFMALGFHSVLSLRYVFFIFLLLSVGVLNYGLSAPKDRTYTFVLSALLAISGFIVTVVNYENLPPIFLMISLGFFFAALDTKHLVTKRALQVMSAAALLLAGFANLAVLPAALVTACAFMYFAYERGKNVRLLSLSFFSLFLCLSIILVCAMPFHGITGVQKVLHLSIIPQRLGLMLWWLVEHYSFPLFLAIPLMYRRYHGESPLSWFDPVVYRIVVLVAAFCILSLWQYHQMSLLQVQNKDFYSPILFAKFIVSLSPYFLVFCYRDNDKGKRIVLAAATLTLFFLLESAASPHPMVFSQLFFVPALATLVSCGVVNYISGIQLRRTRNIVSTLCIMMLLTLYTVGVFSQLKGEAKTRQENTPTSAQSYTHILAGDFMQA